MSKSVFNSWVVGALRCLACVVLTPFSVMTAVLVGDGLYTLLSRVCPFTIVGSQCVAPGWFETLLGMASGGLAASLWVLIGSWTLPIQHRYVPYGVFALGAVFALLLLLDSYMVWPIMLLVLTATYTAGLATAVYLERRSPDNHY